MSWVELVEHLIEDHGETSYLIDQLDTDACRNLHRQLHTYAGIDHQHTEDR